MKFLEKITVVVTIMLIYLKYLLDVVILLFVIPHFVCRDFPPANVGVRALTYIIMSNFEEKALTIIGISSENTML